MAAARCPAALALVNLATGRFTEVNESLERFAGYSCDEPIGRASFELGLWIDLAERERLVKTLAEHCSVRDQEFRFRIKQGSAVIARYSAELFDLEGEIHVLSVLVDTTARKQAEAEVRPLLVRPKKGMTSS